MDGLLGDHTPLGWAVTFAYVLGAVVTFHAAGRLAAGRARRIRREHSAFSAVRPHPPAQTARLRVVPDRASVLRARITFGCGALLLALGANKQLDLHAAVFAAGRRATFALGLYEHRDLLHVLFPALLGVALLGAGAALAFALRGHLRAMAPMIAGFAIYGVFVVLRVALFSHLVRVLGWRWLESDVTAALELGAIALVAGGAVRLARRAPCEVPAPPA